jgi:hypothetical protein
MAKTRRTSIEVLFVIFVGQQWQICPFHVISGLIFVTGLRYIGKKINGSPYYASSYQNADKI